MKNSSFSKNINNLRQIFTKNKVNLSKKLDNLNTLKKHS